jgi:hypothetical protein
METRWEASLATISAVCLPPKHILKQEQLADFFSSLGPRFLAGCDYNAKLTDWGSRLITPRGREVLKTMESQHLHYFSTGEPSYWPSDPNKLPDLLDFCVTKDIPPPPLLPIPIYSCRLITLRS